MSEKKFELTYATMYNPPEELHESYEYALGKLLNSLGTEYGMMINGVDVFSKEKFTNINPANIDQVLGVFQLGKAEDANSAIESAHLAFKAWSRMKWQDRVTLMRKTADIIDERIYTFAAAITLEVGKNRLEALGDIAEASALIRYACDQMESNNGFIVDLAPDPVQGYQVRNQSLLRPYGVWVVISPFNFPAALSAGPLGAALVAGNTVVLKTATSTPWTGRLLAEAFRDAGLPAGVMNFVTGSGRKVGGTLTSSALTAGITFTGSYDVGMGIYRSFAKHAYPRPTILEMGGKNAAIISRNANLDRAVSGLVKSAFGLQGQKCSACSRVLVEAQVYDELVSRFVEETDKLKLGDPTKRSVFNGPVINSSALHDYIAFSEALSEAGTILTGGQTSQNSTQNGYFCHNTIATNVPLGHPLWKQEMFLPITMIHKVQNLEEAITIANDVDYGLTSGFYGSVEEVNWYFDNIEAGVNYANRPHGATTGAWPGYQPFGGWKGSGSTGKNAGGIYYLPLYMREQSRTIVD